MASARPGWAVILGALALAIPLWVAVLISQTHTWRIREDQVAFAISLLFSSGCISTATGMATSSKVLVKAGAFIMLISFTIFLALLITLNVE